MDIQQLHLTLCGALECHNQIIANTIDLLREHSQTEAIACLNSLEAGLLWLYHTTNDTIQATLK